LQNYGKRNSEKSVCFASFRNIAKSYEIEDEIKSKNLNEAKMAKNKRK
jgi:hypothetical protein